METKKAKTKVVVGLLALVGLLVFSLSAVAGSLEPSAAPGPTMKTLDEVEPRIPIHDSDLPLTITEPNSYYLVEDISFTDDANDAITIECNDVTIDLMGYTLKGPDSGTKAGIYMNGRSNVEVHNGTVRDFGGSGIRGEGNGKGLRIIAVRVVSNGGSGISVWNCNNNLIKGCTVGESDGSGITVGTGSTVAGNVVYGNNTGINTGFQCTITGNTVHDNDDIGIIAGYRSIVTGNTVSDNASHGIKAWAGCFIAENTCTLNSEDGILLDQGDCLVINNNCVSNGWSVGSGAGIHADDVGSNDNRIEGNHVAGNDRGIDVESANNLIIKNTASGNSGGDYTIVAGNKVGTISTDPTTAGPWDNFDF